MEENMENRETELLEFKKTTTQLKEAVISLCAMLNKHNHGTVIFGINDNGIVTGQDIGKKTCSDISREIRNHLKPLPEISVAVETVDNKNIIRVTASGTDTPYSAYEKYYTRIDDSDTYMNTNELWKFFESKERTYSKWEEEKTSYTADDIDEEQLISFVRTANEIGRMRYVYTNPEDVLSRLNLLDQDGYLNNAGYYLFGNNGPVTLKEVMYPTDIRDKFTEMNHFKGNIFQCIEEGARFIRFNIHYGGEINGLQREKTVEIPETAIREILVNSFAHCRYIKGDANEITITKSFVKVYNPGNIINDLNPIEFASGHIGSKIRNPLIATALYKCGYIDAFGTGFDRAFRTCADNDTEYEYQNDEFGFTFIFKRKPVYENQTIRSIHLHSLDKQILSLISSNPYITIAQLSNDTGVSIPTVSRHINALTARNLLVRVGSRKSGYWKSNL